CCATTCAAATTAPDSSRISPKSEPVATWPRASDAATQKSNKILILDLHRQFVPACLPPRPDRGSASHRLRLRSAVPAPPAVPPSWVGPPATGSRTDAGLRRPPRGEGVQLVRPGHRAGSKRRP